MTISIPKRLEPRAPLPEGTLRIPATIFQTFKSAEVPRRIHDAASGWIEKNPGFAYRFFDDDDARAFIAGHFDERVLAAYDRTPPGAFRADLWRYCVLYVEGGVYIDIDSICEVPLAEVLVPEDSFVSARAGRIEWAIYNGFICAAPGHPFLKRAMERATDLILDVREGEIFDGYTLAAYDRTPPGAFRADLWRYCVLYVEGGVYIDIDSICEVPLAEVLVPEDSFVSARAGRIEWAIYNGFICAAPGHPFLKRAMERATDLILDVREGEIFDGYTLVGPATLGAAANEVMGRKPKTPHAFGETTLAGHTYRLFRKRPRTAERSGHLLDGDRLVLYTEYPEYRDDIADAGSDHWTATRRREGLVTRALRKGRRLARRII